jgi:hypothetical protein
MSVGEVVASISNGRCRAILRNAPAVALHGPALPRTDGNSPVLVDNEGITAFYSHYIPQGHSYRRRGGRRFDFHQEAVPVRFLDDPDPSTGKWIEAVWSGTDCLYGLYHAEVLAPCERKLFLPEIGIARSQDGGLTWTACRTILRAPGRQTDCAYQNGFFAGGFGDLSALPDRERRFIYMAFTSFVAEENAQGIVMARLDGVDPTRPAQWWSHKGWSHAGEEDVLPQPVWPMKRGWRYPDPDGFWGPAVHYNQLLNTYVMLLNHTAGGRGDLVQEGIYFSVNSDLADPHGWSDPVKLVAGGAWYPQAVWLDPGCSDTRVAGLARFFMAGYSAWTIEFNPAQNESTEDRLLRPTKEMFANLFGRRHAAPW